MSVLIKGMDMPKTCNDCGLRDSFDCWITDSYIEARFSKRNDNCPLVEIPTPHGRLGDLDALKAQYKYGEADSEDEKVWMMNIRRAIANAPTVIGVAILSYPKSQFKRTGKHYGIDKILEAMKA